MSKKLVYIITKTETGGAQKWIKEQKQLLSKCFDIYLITSEPGWLSEQLRIMSFMLKIFYRLNQYLRLIRLQKF